MRFAPMPWSPIARALVPALCVAAASFTPPADAGARRTPLAGDPVVCDRGVQHPITVRIEALDPVRRGSTVRLRLTASSAVGLTGGEAKVTSLGGATLLGVDRRALSHTLPNQEARAEFLVGVPADGQRFLVQFRVQGEGAAGRIARGAAFNLLPDGPQRPARVIASSAGQMVAEYPARRIP